MNSTKLTDTAETQTLILSSEDWTAVAVQRAVVEYHAAVRAQLESARVHDLEFLKTVESHMRAFHNIFRISLNLVEHEQARCRENLEGRENSVRSLMAEAQGLEREIAQNSTDSRVATVLEAQAKRRLVELSNVTKRD
jgi:predicted small metal-binding protein